MSTWQTHRFSLTISKPLPGRLGDPERDPIWRHALVIPKQPWSDVVATISRYQSTNLNNPELDIFRLINFIRELQPSLTADLQYSKIPIEHYLVWHKAMIVKCSYTYSRYRLTVLTF